MRGVLALALAACSAPPSPAPIVAPVATPSEPRIRELPPPAPVTCADAAVILRGPSQHDEEAAAARQRAIEGSCVDGAWSTTLLDCIGDRPTKQGDCLDLLTPEQRKLHDERVGASTPLKPLDCESGIGNVDAYEPVLVTGDDDRVLLTAMRRHALVSRCKTDAWEQGVLQCLDSGRTPLVCRAQLTATQDAAVTTALTEIEQLAQRMTALAKKPAATTCKAIANAHYSDRAWSTNAAHLKGAVKQKAATESRTWLARSCTDEGWTPSMRACAAAGPIGECSRARGRDARWDYTPLATAMGVALCDELARTIAASLRCEKVKHVNTRDAFDGVRASIAAGDLDDVEDLCESTTEELRAQMTRHACKP